MKILKLFVFFSGLMLTAQIYSQTILIDYSATWSYYDNANQPADNGGFDWNDINYNASSWSQGNAQLGYGDSDENTVINANTKTAYFRYNFNVANPSNFDGLSLELIYDDGAVVYLNGNEVWRVNMPNGTVTYSTFSSTSSSDNAFASNSIANSLVAGDNVIAVEIHQSSNSSSDISFDFKATGTIPGAVSISRGPYLQKANASGITVRYRTASATQTIVKYGTDINNLNQTYSDNSPKTEHIADISGLSPNSTYYYRLENSAAVILPEATDLYFKTHPVIGTAQPVTMWILGDCGTANNDQRNVRDAYYNYIGNNHTDGILFLGDNAYNDGTDAQYQNAIFSNMYENKLKNSVAWSCLGNHDGYSTNSNSQTGPYYDIFSFPTAGESGGVASGTEAYYSFDYGNIHFIALESYQTDRSVGGAMYNWALNDIQSTTQDWIVAYWHHPPYTKGSHDSDSEGNLIDMRQNFLPMLESNGVDLVLSGHSHSYERSFLLNGHYGNSNSFNSSTHTVGVNGAGDGQQDGSGEYNKTITGADAGDGAVYITTGSSGKISGGSLNHEAMFYSVSQLGSCVLEVNGNQLDVKFVRETGSIDDYFTIIKEEECQVGASCDDGDACTENDAYDSNCNCTGTALPDSDGDGICDAEDQCPTLDDALIGTSCDDGDSGTENDVYGPDCICAGVPCSPAGTSCDDNDPTTYNDETDGNCNCAGIPCPTAGTSCDDGDPSTINDVEDGFCNCAGETISNTTCITINSGSDDVEENEVNGSMYTNSSDIELVFDTHQSAGNQTIGLRFNAVDVPQGAIITNAYIQFTVDETNSGTTNLTIVGEDADNASSFGAGAYDVTNRQKTSATVSWSPPSWVTVGDQTPDQQTPDISSIIQEIVNRPGFVTNNSMVLVITGTGERTAESYDGSASQAPQLCIEYSTVCQTQGDACDDGDDCTINDVYDANCNCGGTFQDSDSDGICDADDPCDNNTTGNACNDGDDCTINDVIDANCNCVGTFEDSDSDGICDADDQCPTLDDALIGTACDDGDSGTENDIYGTDCICAGTPCSPAGTTCDDNDPSTYNDETDGNCNCAGIPCPTAGTSCDDGDPLTINDEEDGFCNCAGELITNTTCISINSGDDDIEENELNGSMYTNSTDLELVYDTYQSAGNQTIGLRFNAVDVPQGAIITNAYIQFTVDETNSGSSNLTIVGEDADDAAPFGTAAYEITNRQKTQAAVAWSPPDWITVGDQTSDQQTPDISSVIQEIVDRPGYAANNSMALVITGTGERTAESYDGSTAQAPQLCIEYSLACQTQGDSCDDGDDCTINDTIDTNCNCVGTFEDSDGDGVCDANDQCAGSDDTQDGDGDGIPDGCDPCDNNLIGTACSDGDACTINDVYDSDCNCVGTFEDSDGDGVCDANDQCVGSDDTQDGDGDGIPDGCDPCDNNLIGTACSDGDACTINDVYDSDCNCVGTFEDSDGDGVCDANDQCAGSDDTQDGDGDGIPDGCDPCDNNLIGTACSDGDACTINDVYDSDCNCVGTFEDSDGDGVCDANDQCAGSDDTQDGDGDGIPDGCDPCDNNLIGTACSDGDACTINDVYDSDCNCVGTFEDSDGDGVCDANDQCAGSDDTQDEDGDGIPDGCDPCNNNLIGTACSDGDACTINDVYDSDCNCVGTFEDSDGDGICDAEDTCDNNLIGTPCNDGDSCTINDVYDSDCNCVGTFEDSDGDGICDAEDTCDNNLIGTACNDGDACTINDVYDSDCNCVGTFEDSDGDGVCDANDACPGSDDTQDGDGDGIPDGCDPCDNNLIGTACSDGDICTINDVYDSDCNCVGTFEDSDGDGICDAEDTCDNNLTGTACNDGDVCTINDVYDSDCNCVGTFEDSDGDGICDAEDTCDNNLIGLACNDGDACTINDVYDSDCNCVGTFQDSDGDGVCDANDACPGSDDTQDGDGDGIPDDCDICDNFLIGTACSDGDACTINDVYDSDCNCAGTFEDSDGDGVCDANDQCAGSDDTQDVDGDGIPDGCDPCDNNLIGTACSDGDVCTINDVYDSDCNCVGTFEDSDGDGICDAEDTCDNNLTGTACNDGDACTINDVYDSDCNCVGTFEDSDGDGVCDANDQCAGSDDTQDEDGDGIPDGCDPCNNNLIGTACSDGDACTINDVYDSDCNCVGTFEDSDGDGICDAEDTCDNNLTGTACNDGDVCTINDVYDSDCNCVGTFEDSDGDGICDAEDTCDNNLIGTSCNDGDVCTINDVYDSDCNCVGTFQDSDGDGICDAEDTCDNNLIGTSCNDGDVCTINDVYDSDCNCVGTFQDSDGDGICDAEDPCDNNLIGTSCSDGDICTINDVYDSNCNCVGTFEDSDSDGICDADDQCPNLHNSLIGTTCDDGNNSTENDIYGTDCLCAGTPCSPAGTTCDDNDPSTYNDIADGNCNCNGTPCPSAGTSCDDGNPETINDIEDGFCNCEGEISIITTCVSIDSGDDDVEENEINGSMYSNSSDLELVYDNYQSAGNQTIGLRFNSVGVPQGAFIINASIQFTVDETNSGTSNLTIVGEDEDNASAFGTTAYDVTNRQKTQANVAWSPSDWNTVGDQTSDQETPDISSIIQEIVDRPGYVINNSMVLVLTGTGERTAESYNGSPSQAPELCIEYSLVCLNQGDSCDDNDVCTTNDVLDVNCNCVGTVLPDSDNDGICDIEDACPGMDDAMIGQSCDDNDPCTVNDVYDENCNCIGTYQDNDNDGICIGLDPDDNDPCVPNSSSPQCSPCDDILNDGFEINYGAWNDGGGDCTRRTQNANTGIYSVRLRDNSGEASSMTTDMMDLSAYSELTFEFSFYPNSMENGEDFFLEISTDNGSSFTIYRTWARGTDFNNGIRYDEVVVIDDITFTAQTKLRLRCDASGNGDQIYIDDAILIGCSYSNMKQEVIIDQYGKKAIGSTNEIKNHFGADLGLSAEFEVENTEDNYLENDSEEEDFKVYPNPTRNFLYLEGNWDDESNTIVIRNIYGQKLLTKTIDRGVDNLVTLDIAHIPSGIYIVSFMQSQEIIASKKVIILNN